MSKLFNEFSCDENTLERSVYMQLYLEKKNSTSPILLDLHFAYPRRPMSRFPKNMCHIRLLIKLVTLNLIITYLKRTSISPYDFKLYSHFFHQPRTKSREIRKENKMGTNLWPPTIIIYLGVQMMLTFIQKYLKKSMTPPLAKHVSIHD